MMMVRRPILAMVCVILASTAVQAEPPTLDENGLSVGIYDVSSLTAGHRSFLEHEPGIDRNNTDSNGGGCR